MNALAETGIRMSLVLDSGGELGPGELRTIEAVSPVAFQPDVLVVDPRWVRNWNRSLRLRFTALVFAFEARELHGKDPR
jgi:hypothetical protein